MYHGTSLNYHLKLWKIGVGNGEPRFICETSQTNEPIPEDLFKNDKGKTYGWKCDDETTCFFQARFGYALLTCKRSTKDIEESLQKLLGNIS